MKAEIINNSANILNRDKQEIENNHIFCIVAFEIITNAFASTAISQQEFMNTLVPNEFISHQLLNQKSALFVTWKFFNSNTNQFDILKGCIGTYQDELLLNSLKTFAIKAAFQDNRFEPIQQKELEFIQVQISLLGNFKNNTKDIFDWEVGKHGLILKFYDQYNKYYQSTFLPEIPIEQNWQKTQTIDNLIRKSGYQGEINSEFYKKSQLETYETVIAKLSYIEYKQLRKQYLQTFKKEL